MYIYALFMTLEIALLFVIVLAMMVIMALEKLPADTLAITVMVVLILGGFVTPAEGIAGLSNPAVVTILCLMILTIGLESTGVISALGKKLRSVFYGKEYKSLFVLLLIAGCFSSLISTTAIVIVFIRILLKLAKKMPLNLSRYLMPLSFAGILGGSCTLLGTSTNLIVSSIANDYQLPPFEIFEFTPLGVIFFAAGMIYIVFIGRYMIPNRRRDDQDLTEEYAIQGYLAEVLVEEHSSLIGKRVDDTPLFEEEEIDLIEINRQGIQSVFPSEFETLQSGDVLLIKGSLEKLAEIRKRNDLSLLSRQSTKNEDRMNTDDMTLCEVIVKPNSRFIGEPLNKVDIKRDFNAIPLAVKKNRKYYRTQLDQLTIEPGDTLLMEVGRTHFKRFYNHHEFVVLQEHEELVAKTEKRFMAAVIMIMVIALAALNIIPILVSALLGCVAMFLTGCLNLQKAYQRVDWNIYFLLAGVIPLGTAMDNTGASTWIAHSFIELFGNLSPRLLVAVLYITVTLMSAVISNNATAILFAPIVISISSILNLDPRPLLLTVMFAANMSFMSPIGYQTNTLVYGIGQYKFKDFINVGGILSLIIGLLATWLIPAFYF